MHFLCESVEDVGKSQKKRGKREVLTPRVWLACTFLGLAEDVLVVLTLREEESGAVEAAAVTAEVLAEAAVKIIIIWKHGVSRGRCMWQMVNRQFKH